MNSYNAPSWWGKSSCHYDICLSISLAWHWVAKFLSSPLFFFLWYEYMAWCLALRSICLSPCTIVNMMAMMIMHCSIWPLPLWRVSRHRRLVMAAVYYHKHEKELAADKCSADWIMSEYAEYVWMSAGWRGQCREEGYDQVYLYQPAWKKSSGWPPINLYISRVSDGKAEDL